MNYSPAAASQASATTATHSKVTLKGRMLTCPSTRLTIALDKKLTGTLGTKQDAAPITQAPAQANMLH